jgi:hypothetical protein
MVLTTINSGVDTGFSTKLNNNFKETSRYLFYDPTVYSTTATSSTLLTSVNIASSIPKNSIKVIIDAGIYITNNAGDRGGTITVYVGGTLRGTIGINGTTANTNVWRYYRTGIVVDSTTDFSSNRTLAIYGTSSGTYTTTEIYSYLVETI